VILTEELSGTLTPKVDNNWSIVTPFSKDLRGYFETLELLKNGVLKTVTSEDGRTPNVKSINIYDKLTNDEITTLFATSNVPLDIDLSELSSGEIYEILYKSLYGGFQSIVPLEVTSIPLNSNNFTIDVVSLNDFHGALTSSGPNDKNMGAAKLVQSLNEKKLANPNTIFVSAGDNYNGTAMSNLLFGKPVSEMLKEMEITVSAVGNHEFDWGLDKIPTWAKDMEAPFIAANIYENSTNEPVDWAIPYFVKEINGVKFGFLGLTTTRTALTTKPENVKTLTFKNPTEVAKEYVPIMKADGIDVIVLLTHIGAWQDDETKIITLEEDSSGLPFIEGVDAIITGHSHQTISGKINNVPIVQGYYNGRSFAELSFDFDAITSELVSINENVNELYKVKDTISDDVSMSNTLSKYQIEVEPVLGEIIGNAPKDLLHDRFALSHLGEWTSEIMNEVAGTQIAVTNGGGLRTSLLAGDITVGNLYEIMPFDNVLSIFEMSGKQVKEIFEHGVENEEFGSIQFSGATVVHVAGAKEGSKIISITLSNGESVVDDAVYTVVTNDFMGTGGDGFTSFTEANHISETVAIRDSMIDAIRNLDKLEFTPKGLLVEGTIPYVQNNESENNIAISKYFVISGDTLSKIALFNNTTWQLLAKYNNLLNPHLIFPGDEILIPVKK
jgi:2',3'-cyclic-nucleotide 2'-phosphodiesterase / 3'-nucleotidase / 5'-nucleotidase